MAAAKERESLKHGGSYIACNLMNPLTHGVSWVMMSKNQGEEAQEDYITMYFIGWGKSSNRNSTCSTK